ncbi:tRNA (adenosine(37)-N6)-dimethylallyltransferase MiaA [Patescibacteria group bacterium]
MEKQKHKIIVIVGTTSSGKSDLAVEIAKKFDGEVISADSRQVYRDLDIGTGKITKQEMKGVPHHLLDVASPRRPFTAAQFKKKGEKALRDIIKRGKLPIIAGGTGFYIDALLGSSDLPEVPPNPKLRTRLEKKSAPELFAELKTLDPRRAEDIDPHNPRRLIRAIEIASALGAVPNLSAGDSGKYDVLWIGLELDKETLIEKIARRNEQMMFPIYPRAKRLVVNRNAGKQSRVVKKGLVAEVKKLREQNISWKRINELGFEYKFIVQVIKGEIPKEEALQKMNTETWHYAKRQKNWFKRNEKIKWFGSEDVKKIEKLVGGFVNKK